ncbi:MAG: amidohydrolase family protein [Lawsonibacter sp.]|nr:amidohydrolase family protein [Lawsonibacter sp.]
MKFDFSSEAYFDNHTHLLFTDKLSVTPEEFAVNYYHGVRDLAGKDGNRTVSPQAVSHLPCQGVILMLVHAMSEKFGCAPTLEAAAEARNSRTRTPGELAEYTRMLYEDEHIVGTMLDAEHPMSEPVGDCFPCKVFRLFRYEDVFFARLKTAASYDELLEHVLAAVRRAAAEGFAGLKGHIGEKCGFDVREVTDGEARDAFPLAQAGEQAAGTTVYYAVFAHLLELCGQLDIPVHLHTGTTGFKSRIAVYSLDPILMAPFLNRPRFARTKIVLLHGSFPYTRNAAWMAYNFPNVYLDLSQTQLWQGFLAARILEDALSCAPHDKILLGTGQHWYCEMAWLAAKIAKSALAEVLGRMTDQNLLSGEQALRSARMVLSENALRLYEK